MDITLKLQEESSDEFKESVCKVHGTNVAQVRRDVETLKNWLKTQKHLPQLSSDTMLATYIIACKNSIEKAKQKIDNYYTVRGQMPDLFSERDPTSQRIRESSDEVPWFNLPKLTPDGCRVSFGYISSGDAEKYDFIAFLKRSMAFEDVKMNSESYVNGYYFVVDGSKFSMGHVVRFYPNNAKHFIHCIQDVIPVRLKGLIFFKAPTYIDVMLSIIKPFMKGKLLSKVKVHREGPEILEQYFPRALLPKDYGGEEDTSVNLNNAWQKAMEDQREWFINEGSTLTDEKKRIKKSGKKDMEQLQGTFKTLCVD